ncbi:MAG: hypothetical protein GPJ54_14665 [Candidatus Heimdallarchaeota archaeon]|nr:hypothetical protein [Candidatus Heimdallarchaeota archaeon]
MNEIPHDTDDERIMALRLELKLLRVNENQIIFEYYGDEIEKLEVVRKVSIIPSSIYQFTTLRELKISCKSIVINDTIENLKKLNFLSLRTDKFGGISANVSRLPLTYFSLKTEITEGIKKSLEDIFNDELIQSIRKNEIAYSQRMNGVKENKSARFPLLYCEGQEFINGMIKSGLNISLIIEPKKSSDPQINVVNSIKTRRKIKSNVFVTENYRITELYIKDKGVPEGIEGLQHLKILDLSNQGLKEIPDFICKLNSLQTLVLTTNHLKCFHNISKLKINTFDISDNQLTDIPEEISKLKYLKKLVLRRNKIISFESCNVLNGLSSLSFLSLAENGLKVLNNPLQNNSIKSLDLSDNIIKRLPSRYLHTKNGLEFLFLDGNPIEIIEYDKNKPSSLKRIDVDSSLLKGKMKDIFVELDRSVRVVVIDKITSKKNMSLQSFTSEPVKNLVSRTNAYVPRWVSKKELHRVMKERRLPTSPSSRNYYRIRDRVLDELLEPKYPRKQYRITKKTDKQQNIGMKNTWQVKGSKDNIYTVTLTGEKWLCTCPSFKFRKQNCKHIKRKINEVEESKITLRSEYQVEKQEISTKVENHSKSLKVDKEGDSTPVDDNNTHKIARKRIKRTTLDDFF